MQRMNAMTVHHTPLSRSLFSMNFSRFVRRKLANCRIANIFTISLVNGNATYCNINSAKHHFVLTKIYLRAMIFRKHYHSICPFLRCNGSFNGFDLNRMINWFIINETPTRSIRWKHSFFISVYLSSLLSDDVDCVLCLESLVTMPNKTHDFSFSKFTRWISSWLVFRHIHSISNSAGFFIAPIDFNSFFPGDVINLIVISFDMEMKEYIQF